MKRPTAVTVIAAIQFARAGYILFVYLAKWLIPWARLTLRHDVQMYIYVVTDFSAGSPLVPAAAAYAAVTGLGIWHLKKWARNILKATSAVTVLIWLRAFIFGVDDVITDEWARQTVYLTVSFNLLMFLWLAILLG